uniref:Uncharacterized protein n=1 Tax=Pectinophora gossypiella TaxID=13191 RepID=A0A1E1WTC6_PECGO
MMMTLLNLRKNSSCYQDEAYNFKAGETEEDLQAGILAINAGKVLLSSNPPTPTPVDSGSSDINRQDDINRVLEMMRSLVSMFTNIPGKVKVEPKKSKGKYLLKVTFLLIGWIRFVGD